jgi:glycosyltransferase involved in cell wall biosynthesis
MSAVVSVVLPTYDSIETLDEAVRAVLGQTLGDLELIIVDDGSTDETPGYLAGIAEEDARVRVIRQENQGSAVARNAGAAAATGEYLLFVDSDVVIAPKLLEKLVAALGRNPKAAYAYCGFTTRAPQGSWRRPEFPSQPFNAEHLRVDNFISAVSLMRRDRFPGWDPKIRALQDWDLWLTMLDAGDVGTHVPELLFETIDREGSITQSWSRDHYSEALANVAAKHQKVGVVTILSEGDEAQITALLDTVAASAGVRYRHYVIDVSEDGALGRLSLKAREDVELISVSSWAADQALKGIVNRSDFLAFVQPGEELWPGWLYELVRLDLYARSLAVFGIAGEGQRDADAYGGGRLLGRGLRLVPELHGPFACKASLVSDLKPLLTDPTPRETLSVRLSGRGYILGEVLADVCG